MYIFRFCSWLVAATSVLTWICAVRIIPKPSNSSPSSASASNPRNAPSSNRSAFCTLLCKFRSGRELLRYDQKPSSFIHNWGLGAYIVIFYPNRLKLILFLFQILRDLESLSRSLPRLKRSTSEPTLYRQTEDFMFPLSSPRTPMLNGNYNNFTFAIPTQSTSQALRY